MSIYRVTDLSRREFDEARYDLAILGSGYEDRCTYLSKLLSTDVASHSVVLGFQDLAQTEPRKLNDAFMRDHWKVEPLVISANDDAAIYEFLRTFRFPNKMRARILVDYTSMSRIWYTAVLNWARLGDVPQILEIDFAYSIGKYGDDGSPMIIQDMLAIPGCEGGALKLDKSVAVFGLGFNGLAALCVLDRLEADTVYAYRACPAATEEYETEVMKRNKDFIEEQRLDDKILNFPLRSVETCYRYLSELIAPHRFNDEVTLVPMGPKPHVLASMLVSMQFPEVSCLRINAKREKPEKVSPIGELITTRVEIRKL